MNLFALVNGSPWFFGPVTFSGSITFAGTALFANGTAAAPSISFATQTDLGFYKIAATELGLAAAGVRIGDFYTYSSGLGIQGGSNGNGAYLGLSHQGAIALVAGTNSANQSITLTPSGTGQVTVTNTTGATSNSPVNVIGQNNTSTWVRVGNNVGAAHFGVDGSGNTAVDVETGSRDMLFSFNGVTKAKLTFGGNFLVGTVVDSGALLQVGTNTTAAAGGMIFGTDLNVYRSGTRELTFLGASSSTFVFAGTALGSTIALKLGDGTNNNQGIIESQNGTLVFKLNATTALTLDTSQRCILSGALRLNNAYTVGAPIATGYLTLQDSAGTTYKVLVGT